MVFVSHGFGAVPPADGHDIRSLTLTADGLVDDGVRLDVATRVVRIAFTPSGRFAIVLGKTGDGPTAIGVLASVRVDDAQNVTVVSSVELPIFGPEDLVVTPTLDGDALRVYVIDRDVTEATGVHALRVTCDGTLTVDAAAFHGIRLADTMALLGDTGRALLVGGQAVFDPIDDDDLRLLSLGDDTAQVDAFNFFSESLDVTRIAANTAGTRVVVPNGSPFAATEGGTILLLGVNGDAVTELDRAVDYPASYEALIAPDDQSVLVASFELDRIVSFSMAGDQLAEGDIVTVNLAEQMDVVRRGVSSGVVLAAAVTDVRVLQIDGPGSLVDVETVELGEGNENIVTAIAVQP